MNEIIKFDFPFQATLEFSKTEVFDVLVPGVEEWPVWNPTILDCKVGHQRRFGRMSDDSTYFVYL